MKIIISPAKKMREHTDIMPATGLPEFLHSSQEILNVLQNKSFAELKKIWKCNDKLVQENKDRLLHMNLWEAGTPALLAYEGIQYKYMAAEVFSDDEYAYLQDHLRILSGFYGILKPLDAVTPYRLEMNAGLEVGRSGNLYDFWGDRIYQSLTAGDSLIINLASEEYGRVIRPYLQPGDRLIQVEFCEVQGSKRVQKGTWAKMARGEMVRFCATGHVQNPAELVNFRQLGFAYCPDLSTDRNLVFLKNTCHS